MNKKIVLLGGGGHCKSIIDSLVQLGVYDEIVILDKESSPGTQVLGYSVIGDDSRLDQLWKDGFRYGFVAQGGHRSGAHRQRLSQMLMKLDFELPSIVDPSAIVSSEAVIGRGCFIGKRSVINADATLGEGVIINSGALVEHDCRIGRFSNIAPAAVVLGGVTVGERTYIGSNAVIRENISIGDNAIIGMGSVVTRDICSGVIAYGNPCKVIEG